MLVNMLHSKYSFIPSYLCVFRLGAIGRTTEWHEGHSRFEKIKKHQAHEKMIAKEIVNANSNLKTMRHNRLAELYAAENEM